MTQCQDGLAKSQNAKLQAKMPTKTNMGNGTIQQLNRCTPLKFNMEPENGGLDDDFPFQLGDS